VRHDKHLSSVCVLATATARANARQYRGRH
jgi:hypothetical protein